MSDSTAARPLSAEAEGASPRADRAIYRREGPDLFGAAARLGAVLDRIADMPRALVLDMSAVPLVVSSGARAVQALAARMQRRGAQLYLAGLQTPQGRQLAALGIHPPQVRLAEGIAAVDAGLDRPESVWPHAADRFRAQPVAPLRPPHTCVIGIG